MADARRILLIEDNPDDEELTMMALRVAHVLNEVTVAHDGDEALRLLLTPERHEYSQPPALTLLDLKLPKIDGLEVLHRIRTNEPTRSLPVVILTSSAEEQDLLAGYRNGANAYVRKPVEFGQFTDAIKTLGLFWLVLNEPPPTW
jgi:two-component system, response regulator